MEMELEGWEDEEVLRQELEQDQEEGQDQELEQGQVCSFLQDEWVVY